MSPGISLWRSPDPAVHAFGSGIAEEWCFCVSTGLACGVKIVFYISYRAKAVMDGWGAADPHSAMEKRLLLRALCWSLCLLPGHGCSGQPGRMLSPGTGWFLAAGHGLKAELCAEHRGRVTGCAKELPVVSGPWMMVTFAPLPVSLASLRLVNIPFLTQKIETV